MTGGFGAFGKMPALGDFFRVGVAPSFVEPWDQWLQEGIVAVREALADRWNDCFMQAPIWRFTTSSGLVGAAPALGVMMPSVDRVGRLFPLTLVAPLPEESGILKEHFGAETTFQSLEAIALDALDDTMTRDALSARLESIQYAAEETKCRVLSTHQTLAVTGCPESGFLPELAANLVGRDFDAPSVWSTSFEGGSRLLTIEGMPNIRQMQGLFDLDAPVWREGAVT